MNTVLLSLYSPASLKTFSLVSSSPNPISRLTSAIHTFNFSSSSRKLIFSRAVLPIFLALAISWSCSWNDMYWIHRKDEFGEAKRARSKSVSDSGLASGAVDVRSSRALCLPLDLERALAAVASAASSSSSDDSFESASEAASWPVQSNPPATFRLAVGSVDLVDLAFFVVAAGFEARSI